VDFAGAKVKGIKLAGTTFENCLMDKGFQEAAARQDASISAPPPADETNTGT
jgi:hypothetical protein